MLKISSQRQLIEAQESLSKARKKDRLRISVCGGTGCMAAGCKLTASAIKDELSSRNLTEKIEVNITGCHGFCEQGPIVVVRPKNIFYPKIKPKDVSKIIEQTVVNGDIVEELLYKDPVSGKTIIYEDDIPFYREQNRLVFGNNSDISPSSLEDYLALGGYGALNQALFCMTSNEVIETVKASGLRGRGGGGFLTAKKWASCLKAAGDDKYIICNADEGDPGAFMDRSLLEGNPHAVIEGMLIGGYAVSSSQGIVYVRHEYPLAVKHLEIALDQAREASLLGKNILGSDFSFDIRLSRGGGAFICGESSALIASLEGKTGEPRAKYVHTVEQGLFKQPTVINNVETWVNVPLIIKSGAKEYAKLGTAGSKGTKIFSLVGKINNTGLVEVPMGITLRDIIYKIGGGIPGGKRFKAVQTGGPSGGCLPESMLDLPVDFDQLTQVGSMMGSGGMIVMDETTCMVDVARYFIHFLSTESCGKCLPCREGLTKVLEILDRITMGFGKVEDLNLLDEIGIWLSEASLCALGGSAANPLLSTLRYFKDEYEAHIIEKRCPASVCKKLISYRILEDRCNGCQACTRFCPVSAISGARKEIHHIDTNVCVKCGACLDRCKKEAIIRN